MSLKLIREAHLASTLSKAELRALSIIKTATSRSLVDMVSEAFTPTADDFETWMRVVVGEAQDRGVNLNKKAEFTQLVMDILENDPVNPPIDMQEAIALKLWQDYKGVKSEVRINKIAAAKEEEEKVEAARKQIAQRYAQGSGSRTTTNPSAYDEEEMAPMGISDDLAARKIFDKIKGTPNLNFATIQQFVGKYAPMVGKSPTDVKYISAQVYGMLQDVGMAEENEEEDVMANFLKDGGEIQHIPAHRTRKSEKWQGSAHIGKTGGRSRRVSTGNAANTMGRPVIGMPSVGNEEEESGFAQAFNLAMNTEDEEDSMSFLNDVLKDRSSRPSMDKGSFSSHLRGDDEDFDDEDFDDDDDDELVDTLDNDGDGDLSDDELFTSDDDDEDFDDEDFDDEDSDDEDFDDNTMDDVDADISRKKLKPSKSYDEEEAVKSFFRQAATAPRNMMTQAIKDIEGEGKTAWTSSNVPKNPHPQKSAAYRAWQRGMLAAAKESLGIVDKPKEPKKAKKKK